MGPEAKIQKKVVDWARKEYAGQLIARKAQAGVYGSNGWPDYEFNVKGGRTFFIEFKAPGEQPTPLQERRHKELRALGFDVFVEDDAARAKETIKSAIYCAGLRRTA